MDIIEYGLVSVETKGLPEVPFELDGAGNPIPVEA